jgi:hypothetical protein
MYYTLLVQWEQGGPWSPEFGDYVKRAVVEERGNYVESYDLRKKQTMIVACVDDTQAALTEAMANIN